MLFVAAIVVLVSGLLWTYVCKYRAFRAPFAGLPGDPSFNYLFGNLHKYPGPTEEGIAYDLEMARKWTYFHCMWVGPLVPVIMLYHPESIRPVLKALVPKPRNKFLSTPYDMGVPWLGEGLLLTNGPRWVRNRRLLTPSFHLNILKSYIGVYNECSLLLVNKMKELCSGGQSFDVFKPASMCALDVVLRCAFSYQSDCQIAEGNEYISAMSELMNLWIKRSYAPHLILDWIYSLTSAGRRFYHLCDMVHGVAESIIDKRRKELEIEGPALTTVTKKCRDFLDTLLTSVDEDGNGLSALEIRNEVDTFLLAGHDTTASGVAWTLYHLSQHPEYQERIYEEVLEVLSDRQTIVWEDLSHLEFTTMCIKEALRLEPSVPAILRKLVEDTEIMGHVIPAGTLVCAHLSSLHKNPNIWDRAREYLPDRFHPDKLPHPDPLQYIPFSVGSRNCIGQNFAMMEMKITIANVIRNFQLSCDSSKPARRFLTPTLKAEAGAMIFAKYRDL